MSATEVLTPAPVAISGFSYATLDAEAEQVARASATAIRAVTATAIPEIGRHLLAAKTALPHGKFTDWAQAELGLTARAARNYMAAAQWLEGKPETVSVLPPTVLYQLASSTAPAEVVEEVIAASAEGAIDPEWVKGRLWSAGRDQDELRRAQKRNPQLTAKQLRERKQKAQERFKKQDEARTRQLQQEQAEREVRLTPLVERIAEAGLGFVLMCAMDNWEDQRALHRMLSAAHRETLA